MKRFKYNNIDIIKRIVNKCFCFLCGSHYKHRAVSCTIGFINDNYNGQKKYNYSLYHNNNSKINNKRFMKKSRDSMLSLEEVRARSNRGSIIIIFLVIVLNISVFYVYYTSDNRNVDYHHSYVKNNQKVICIKLKDIKPAYILNERNLADLDFKNTKFIWDADMGQKQIKSIIDDLSISDFDFNKVEDLQNGENITVVVEKDTSSYKVSGSITFEVIYKEKDENDISNRIKNPKDYFFEYSHYEYLTKEQLCEIKTSNQLRIAINEIYARHGYCFRNNETVQKYFDSKSWYERDETVFEDSHIEWNKYEYANLKKLTSLKKGKLDYHINDPLTI